MDGEFKKGNKIHYSKLLPSWENENGDDIKSELHHLLCFIFSFYLVKTRVAYQQLKCVAEQSQVCKLVGMLCFLEPMLKMMYR